MFLIGVNGNLFPSRESAPWSKDFDAKTYNCPDYDEMICKSMDLQIMVRTLSMRKYKDIETVLGDVKLIVNNYYTKGRLRLGFLSWISQFRTHRISTPTAIAQSSAGT
jgi:hypothetical protein